MKKEIIDMIKDIAEEISETVTFCESQVQMLELEELKSRLDEIKTKDLGGKA